MVVVVLHGQQENRIISVKIIFNCISTEISVDVVERNRGQYTDAGKMRVTAQRIKALFCRVATNQQELDMQRLLAGLKI